MQVFLTDQAGPGTTVANEIASAAIQANLLPSDFSPPYTLTSIDILSVPSLAAGTYYVTISLTGYSGPAIPMIVTSAPPLVVTTDVGVSVSTQFGTGNAEPYLPASTYNLYPDISFWLSATGDRAQDLSGVPEPSTLALSLGGVVLLWAARVRKLRRVRRGR